MRRLEGLNGRGKLLQEVKEKKEVEGVTRIKFSQTLLKENLEISFLVRGAHSSTAKKHTTARRQPHNSNKKTLWNRALLTTFFLFFPLLLFFSLLFPLEKGY